jgi:hypothetical protein
LCTAVVFTPSMMRRMMIVVVGVPLPGRKVSWLKTTYSLPSSCSSTLPLRTSLAMTLTT